MIQISEIHKNATADRKPVLVYIHPGGFYGVSGQSKNFAGPQNLMDRDIVLVTLNYRLGSLGMMAAGTKEYPGNAALKDQVLVLKWIKDHIGQFGGNPNMVTIMGYSAGGMSVTLHMVSPMSKGKFCLIRETRYNTIILENKYYLRTLSPCNRDEWIGN